MEDGDDKWHNIVAAKFLMKRVLTETEDDASSLESVTLQDRQCDLPNNSVDLTAISEESHSHENKSEDSLVRGVINEAFDKAHALVEYQPTSFLERITQMAYSSESAAAAIQVNEASITTSFQSLRLERTPVKMGGNVMGRDERECRKKEFIELWENHVDGLMAQDQNVSLEYEVQMMNSTDVLLEEELALQKKLHRISEDLETRKKLLHGLRLEDLNEQERLLLDKLEDYDLSKDENSIFYRIEQSILNKDRPISRCMSVESTGTQTTNSLSTSTPNYSTFGDSSDNSAMKNRSGGDRSRIPIRSPKPRVLFEQHANAQQKKSGTVVKPKVVTKSQATNFGAANSYRVRTNSSAIFSVYPSTPAKENVNVFQKRENPSPRLWVSIPQKCQKRVAESPITPKTAKKPNKISNVTLRQKIAARPQATASGRALEENRVNTFRDMDLETEKLRGTIDRCTNVISDIGQSVQEMKVSLAEVATAQSELNEEIKSLNKSR